MILSSLPIRPGVCVGPHRALSSLFDTSFMRASYSRGLIQRSYSYSALVGVQRAFLFSSLSMDRPSYNPLRSEPRHFRPSFSSTLPPCQGRILQMARNASTLVTQIPQADERQSRGTNTSTKPIVAYHLFACAALVYLIIVVGGLTRLTESGLSITEWNPGFKGMRLPWTDEEWDAEWEKYKQTPEWVV